MTERRALHLWLLVGFASTLACATPTGPAAAVESIRNPPPGPTVPDPPPEPADAGDKSTGPEWTIDQVMANAIDTPDPDQVALAETKAARFDHSDGEAVIGFCVDRTGKTFDVRSLVKFPGDPLVDKILRDTVAKWRFKPFAVDGAPVEPCTARSFELRFQ